MQSHKYITSRAEYGQASAVMYVNNNNDSNDFLLTSSFEEEIRKIVQYKKTCPTCKKLKKTFYCNYCIVDGEFIYSTIHVPVEECSSKERFIEKKLRQDHLLRVKINLIARIEDSQKKQSLCQLLKDKILKGQHQVDTLKQYCEQKRQLCNTNRKKYDYLTRQRFAHIQRCDKYMSKILKTRSYITTYAEYICKKKTLLVKRKESIATLRKFHVDNLIAHIFSLDVTEHAVIDDEVDSESRVSELAEAIKTVHIDGEWMYSEPNPNNKQLIPGSGSTTATTVSQPTLDYWIVTPYANIQASDGNYTTYFTCPSTRVGRVEPVMNPSCAGGSAAGTSSSCNTGFHRVAAALAYITQLVNVLALLLHVNLPKYLCYSIFSSFTLDSRTFHKAVKRLQRNVIYLCLSQGVDAEQLRNKHMLQHLQQLIISPHLAKCGWYEVAEDVMLGEEGVSGGSLEDSYHIVEAVAGAEQGGAVGVVVGDSAVSGTMVATASSSSSSDSEHASTEPLDDMQEWEAVPNLPYTELPVPQPDTHSTYTSTTAFLGSVTSWFRTTSPAHPPH